MIDADRLFAALEATWPPRARRRLGPWVLRDGDGGGNRVSAATARLPISKADIAALEVEAASMGKAALVQVRPGDPADDLLGEHGYEIRDPTLILTSPLAPLGDRTLPRLAAIPCWPPLARMREIWEAGGIGAPRLRVMSRADAPKIALFGRISDRPAAVAFVAIHDRIAMIHALEVAQTHRRAGAGRNLVIGAAKWAGEQGAETVAVAVTEANAPARALYSALGFSHASGYHYRQKTT